MVFGVTKERLHTFLGVIRAAYLGENFSYKGEVFRLEPTLVSPYDFIRKISAPRSKFEELLASLDEGFKSEARTELYRAERGWIDQGMRGYGGLRIREVKANEKNFLVPVLSNPAVGIDTSGIKNTSTVFAFCSIADPEAGYVFLEKHLNLPKAKDPIEYKWSKLNPQFKTTFFEKFEPFLNFFHEGVLILHTNAFIGLKAKRSSVFANLINGCFTGYEYLSKQRRRLRGEFFRLTNGMPVHCDADFRPLMPSNIVRLLIQTLATPNGGTARPFTPLHAPLKSHESKPIQLADIVAGSVTNRIEQEGKPPEIFTSLFFDRRKIKHLGKEKFARAYYWIKG